MGENIKRRKKIMKDKISTGGSGLLGTELKKLNARCTLPSHQEVEVESLQH